MNEIERQEIYNQVQDAIKRKLHLGMPPKTTSMYGIHWQYPDKIEDDKIIMRDSDCGSVKPVIPIDFEEWDRRIKEFGLWKKVGLWSFVEADNPAAECIKFCHKDPESAGRELYRIRKLLSELRNN